MYAVNSLVLVSKKSKQQIPDCFSVGRCDVSEWGPRDRMGGGIEGTTGNNKNKVFIGWKDKKEMKQVKSASVTKDPQVAGLGLQLAYANWPLSISQRKCNRLAAYCWIYVYLKISMISSKNCLNAINYSCLSSWRDVSRKLFASFIVSLTTGAEQQKQLEAILGQLPYNLHIS